MFDPSIFRKLNVKTYLIAIFVIVSIIPLLFLGLIQYKNLNENFITASQKNNLLLIEQLADKIGYSFEMNFQTLDFVVSELEKDPLKQKKYYFQQILANYRDFKALLYYHENKLYYVESKRFVQLPANESLFLLEINQVKNHQLVLFAKKNEKDLHGSLIGIKRNFGKDYLIAILNMNRLKEDFLKIKAERKEDVFLLDNNNNILLSTRDELKDDYLKRIIKAEKMDILGNIDYDSDNIKKTATYRFIEPLAWLLWIESPLSLYDEEIRNNALLTLLAAFVSLTLAILISLIMADSQDKVVKNLIDSIRAISKGNYSQKVSPELTFIPQEFDLLIGEFNDMSERIKQLDGFKSNLIDTVSHEFRTPLTSIKGFSSTLLRTDANFDRDTQRKLLKIISQQADRLSRMVEDLLVVPKLEKNILKLNFQYVDLEQVLESVSAFFPERLFKIIIPEPVLIYVDQDRVEQIFLNLLENACKYSFPKESEIKITVREKEGFAEIFLENPSELVDPEQLEKLFEKFYRVDSTLTRTSGGTGLGLYITKSLTELMNGQIQIKFSNGFFIVYLRIPTKSEDKDFWEKD